MNDSIKARCICWTDGLWKDEKPKLVIVSVSVLITAVIFVKLKLVLYCLACKRNLTRAHVSVPNGTQCVGFESFSL